MTPGRAVLSQGSGLRAVGVLAVLLAALGGTAWAQGSDDAKRCAEEKTLDLKLQQCSQAIQSGRLSEKNLAVAFTGLGIAHQAKGDYDRAIQDFDQALRLDPDHVLAFFGRGFAYRAKGDYDRAIQDYDQILRLDPKDPLGFVNRGLTRFSQGQFAAGVPALVKAVELAPSDAYPVLWLYLAQSRAGQNARDELVRAATRLNLTQWPGPVVSLYLGTSDEQAVVAAAADTDPRKQREQQCEAYFYVGQYHLLQGRKAEAAKMFQAAVATGVTSFVEFDGAKAELGRLGY